MEQALTDLGGLVTTALGIITGNPVLMCFFCSGLLGVAFVLIKQAKRASRN